MNTNHLPISIKYNVFCNIKYFTDINSSSTYFQIHNYFGLTLPIINLLNLPVHSTTPVSSISGLMYDRTHFELHLPNFIISSNGIPAAAADVAAPILKLCVLK